MCNLSLSIYLSLSISLSLSLSLSLALASHHVPLVLLLSPQVARALNQINYRSPLEQRLRKGDQTGDPSKTLRATTRIALSHFHLGPLS